MSQKVLSFFLFFFSLIFSATAVAKPNPLFAGGSGTPNDPYQITTCQQLQNMNQNLNGNYALINDINCADTRNWNSGQGFVPVGNGTTPFTGNLDGNGYTIDNVYMNQPDGTYTGIFGDSSGVITNLNVKSENITAVSSGSTAPNPAYIGGAVAYNSGTISNVSIETTIHGSGVRGFIGGLVGSNCGKITYSQSHGTLQADYSYTETYPYIGGLVGYSFTTASILNSFSDISVNNPSSIIGISGGLVGTNDGRIQFCYATGDVTSNAGDRAGGLLGWNQGNGKVLNDYAQGNVFGPLVGGLLGSNSGSVQNTYATGKVTAINTGGGLVGRLNSGSISNSYYDVDTSDQHDTGKGTPETTQQMFQQVTFNGWDFTNTWHIAEGHDYPRLQWQNPQPLNIIFLPITSPQQTGKAFPVTIVANTADFNGPVYLHSVRGDTDPNEVNLMNGLWSGNIIVYTIGENDALQIRWQPATRDDADTNESNTFDVLTAAGQMLPDANLSGVVTDDDENPIANVAIKLFLSDPANNPQLQPVYSTSSNSNGDYTFSAINPGNYYLQASQTNYQDYLIRINTASQRIVTNNIQLDISCSSNVINDKVPVLLVPGIMGSKTGDVLWQYPRLSSANLKWDSKKLVLFDPFGIIGWGSLTKFFEKAGYKKGCTVFDVPYDWSETNTQIRDHYLIPWIKKAEDKTGSAVVDIVAHSMGGLVTRSYIQSSGYNKDIRRFAIVGTPSSGSDNVYYIWEGGDPIKADIAGNNVNFPAAYFYSNTLNYLYRDRTNGEVCRFSWFGLGFTPKECNNSKIYDFMNANKEGLSAGQLMPSYNNALINMSGVHENVPINIEENSLVKALNGVACANPKGCLDPWGSVYQFTAPTIMTADTSGVQTYLFGGTGQETTQSIFVTPQPAGYAGKFYKDGAPLAQEKAIKVVSVNQGDGTVLESSVNFNNYLPAGKSLPYLSTTEEHASLIKKFAQNIVNFITHGNPLVGNTGNSLSDDTDVILPQLLISVDGNVTPHVSVTDAKGKTIKLSDTQETSILNLNDSSIAIDSPPDGSYTITVTAPSDTDYQMSISYSDPNNNIMQGARFTDDIQAGETKTFRLAVHHLTEKPSSLTIAYSRNIYSPQDPEMTEVNNQIQLSWQDPAGYDHEDVDHYIVYWRPETQPYFQFLANVWSKTYLTPHPWSDAAQNVYVVKAVLKGNQETVFSDPTFYDPDNN